MRYPKKTYPKAFSVLFGILAAAFILFLICLGVQPAEPAKLSQTEDSQSDFASVSDPAASRQESNDEISQSDAVLEPPSDDKSLDTFVDWVIWYAEQEPRFPVKEDGSTVYGELFSDPYAQWCTEFLMYCFQKAEDRLGTSYLDSVYPWYPSSYSCGLWFKAYYHYFDVGTYIPARGDMILFDTYGIGYPDHIALVVEVADSAEGDPVITTIEGNILTDPVPQIRSRQLSCTDSTIFGYGSIRSANYAYDGPIKYYSEADAPQESGAESADGWEEADLWWDPEEDEEIFAEEKGKRKFR